VPNIWLVPGFESIATIVLVAVSCLPDLAILIYTYFDRTEGPREQAAVAGVFGPFLCSWLSDFRTPTLKNRQKGMPPNRPTSLNNIILLKIDMFYDKA
jgi:hypothetical protein